MLPYLIESMLWSTAYCFLLLTLNFVVVSGLHLSLYHSSKRTRNSFAAMANKDACVPCSLMDQSFLLSKEQVEKELSSSLPLWQLGSNEQNPAFIHRHLTARNFQSALDCINEMGAIAERQNHHPNFHLTNYRDVEVVIWTHKLNGVTEADITLATMFDREVKINYSPKWLKENPEALSTSK